VTRTRDLALIRKLCGLGLPPQTLAQSLLPALRTLIPSHSGGVFWVDGKGEITNLFAERLLPPESMAEYYERHHRRANEGFAIAFRKRAEAAEPISTRSFSRGEQESDYFREVMKPLDAYHLLYAVLRDESLPYAQLSLYRGTGDRPFGRSDTESLKEVLRYVASGLTPNRGRYAAVGDSMATGEHLGIVGLDGTLISAPEGWRNALRLAAVAEVSPKNARRELDAVGEFLRHAVEKLRLAGGDKVAIDHANPWGRFAIRAFRLADARGRREDHVAVLIRREEPRSLSLLRGLGASGLSPQQREVAMLLADGKSNREIAEALRLRLNTASYHVKQVFARLGVNERGAVTQRVLELARHATT
jgi:DNA-binding CsgD family transcriptional regulator